MASSEEHILEKMGKLTHFEGEIGEFKDEVLNWTREVARKKRLCKVNFDHQFNVPEKFQDKNEVYMRIEMLFAFIIQISNHASNRVQINYGISKILNCLAKVERSIVDFLPFEENRGQVKYKLWYDKLSRDSDSSGLYEAYMAEVVPLNLRHYIGIRGARTEAWCYFRHCFGSKSDHTYQSSHELNFFLWLYSLRRMKAFESAQYSAIVKVILPCYQELVMCLIKTFELNSSEPELLPYIPRAHAVSYFCGASELMATTEISVSDINDDEKVGKLAASYTFFQLLKAHCSGLCEHLTNELIGAISSKSTWKDVRDYLCYNLCKFLGEETTTQVLAFGSVFDK